MKIDYLQICNAYFAAFSKSRKNGDVHPRVHPLPPRRMDSATKQGQMPNVGEGGDRGCKRDENF